MALEVTASTSSNTGAQLFIVGGDQLHRAFGGVRIGGQHDGDRLADIAHLVERQDRLIVERRDRSRDWE